MNELLDQLLQLKNLSTGGEGVEWRFAHNAPAWLWAFGIAACALIAGWSYWKLLGAKAARVTLATLRTLTLVLVMVLIAGPELVRPNERTERDWVVVMADRSASMTVADVPPLDGEQAGGARRTREDQLNATLQQNWPMLRTLATQRNVLFLGFDAGASELRVIGGDSPGDPPAGLDLRSPVGQRTLLSQSIEQALRRVAARPVAGIVLLSDGRSADQPGRSLLRQLEARQVPIFAVPLGSTQGIADLSVRRVEAPTAAFVGDIVPVSVDVARSGAAEANGVGGGQVRVQLVDAVTGRVMDERSATFEAADAQSLARVTLNAKPESGGGANWIVRIVPETPDLSADNNQSPLRIELVDRPVRVAYFDGYPRWENRYLKNLLLREKSIRSSSLILASDRRFIQEGSDILPALPRSASEWAPFDVIIMGDLRPGLFTEEQLQQLRALVAERGAGLLWIGGSGSTPGAWAGTPLADLLPFTLRSRSGIGAGGGSGVEPWLEPVLLAPGPASSRFGVMRLGESVDEPWPATLTNPDLGWNALRWAQRIEPTSLKPAAEVLTLAMPIRGGQGSQSATPTPLVMTMRYGAGRVVYVATDEIWRLRYARGETLPERFWIPLIRLLARESIGRSGKPAVIEATPQRAQVDQPVQVTVSLLDQSLVESRPDALTLRVKPAGSTSGSGGVELRLRAQEEEGGAMIRTFTGSFVPTDPGSFTIEPSDAIFAALDISAPLEVFLPEDELRTPQTDHPALAALAQASGGQVLAAEDLSRLPDLLPNRQVSIAGTPDVETLWDKPVVWVVLMLLLGLEWVGRRLIKLS